MPNTYTPIASTAVSGTATYLTFSGIPNTYTDLVLIGTSINSNTSFYYIDQINGNTSNIYSFFQGVANGGSTYPDYGGAYDYAVVGMGGGANGNATMMWNFMNYSNTNVFKTILGTSGRQNFMFYLISRFDSTAAISSFRIGPSNTFQAGTIFTLYGIKAA